MEFIKGRMRRLHYWLGFLGIFFLMVGLRMGIMYAENEILFAVMLLLSFLGSILIVVMSIPRLHDAGFSGWYALLGLIPLVCIALWIMCMIPSEKKDNKWGKYER